MDSYTCSFFDMLLPTERVEIVGAFLSTEIPENTDLSVKI